MKQQKCHICGRSPAEGHDYRAGQGGKPLCHTCAAAIGHNPQYRMRQKR